MTVGMDPSSQGNKMKNIKHAARILETQISILEAKYERDWCTMRDAEARQTIGLIMNLTEALDKLGYAHKFKKTYISPFSS